MGQIQPQKEQIVLDISPNGAKISSEQTYALLMLLKPMLLALRRGFIAVVIEIERLYNLRRDEEIYDAALARLIDERIDEHIKRAVRGSLTVN